MKVSLIIPAYNSESTIKECLESVFRQTIRDYEVIVINDGSTDQTEAVLREYKVRYQDKLVYKTVENGGQGRARNIGIELSRGAFIGFVDSDDWIDPDFCEKLLEAMEKEDGDIALCDVAGHFPDGRVEQEYIYRPSRKIAAAGFANNKLFRRNLIENIRYPENKLWYEDTEFTAIALHRTEKISHVPETLYHYRRGLPSTMNNNNAKKNLDILTVMDHLETELIPDAQDDLEFLILNHVLLEAIKRVNEQESADKKEVIRELRNYVRTRIPDLSRCRSFREESRNRRIIMKLNYDGFEKVSGYLLKAKQSLT